MQLLMKRELIFFLLMRSFLYYLLNEFVIVVAPNFKKTMKKYQKLCKKFIY